MDVHAVLDDLAAEQQSLDEIVSTFGDESFVLETASERWTVSDQLGHLAYFDRTAALAIVDPDAFQKGAQDLVAQIAGGDLDSMDVATLSTFRAMEPQELLKHWRTARAELVTAGQTLTNDQRVVWYGPSMGSKSFLTARLMECWAHGQDIVDAAGVVRPATDRLLHIAQLGFITRNWSYKNRGQEMPAVDLRVELVAPSGQTWTFGPDTADEFVTGSAEDFCLVVTQRRHVRSTDLSTSPAGLDWMERAQAFAGPPTYGPDPLS